MGKAKNIATAAGAGAGYLAGAGIGIAGFFGAVSGAVPLALVGAYAARKLVQTRAARSFIQEFSSAYKEHSAAKRAEYGERLDKYRTGDQPALPKATRKRTGGDA
ncbi:MAG: hypothetical protein KGM60_07515 [Comamonadaceae bacterium]|nr:hypothetical protein [Comamonadaceae bacterium]